MTRRSRGVGARALGAVLIGLLLGAWVDAAGARAAMRPGATAHCDPVSGMRHHAGVAVASSQNASHQDCTGLQCPLVRHCGSSTNGTCVLDLVPGPSRPARADTRSAIDPEWLPRTRHIAPPTPPPLVPLDLTA